MLRHRRIGHGQCNGRRAARRCGEPRLPRVARRALVSLAAGQRCAVVVVAVSVVVVVVVVVVIIVVTFAAGQRHLPRRQDCARRCGGCVRAGECSKVRRLLPALCFCNTLRMYLMRFATQQVMEGLGVTPGLPVFYPKVRVPLPLPVLRCLQFLTGGRGKHTLSKKKSCTKR